MRYRLSDLILHGTNKVIARIGAFIAIQFLIEVFDRFAELGFEVIEHASIRQFGNC